MQMTPGTNLLWNRGRNPYTCTITIVQTPQRKGAKAMLGYASTFRKPRTTAEWMKELREGEQPVRGLRQRCKYENRRRRPKSG